VPRPVPGYAAALDGGVRGLRVGLPKEYFVEGMSAEVSTAVRTAVRHLESLGASIEEVSLPHTEYAVAAYYLIATAEASSNLARYDGTRYGLRVDRGKGLLDMYRQTRGAGFGTEVKRRIMLGTYALSAGYYDAFYLKGQRVRTLIRRDFEKVFETCQAIVTPTAPTTAFKLGEKVTDPLEMYLSDIFTISVNLAGLPGLSLPCGFDSQGLPIGLQNRRQPFDEETVLPHGLRLRSSPPTGFHGDRALRTGSVPSVVNDMDYEAVIGLRSTPRCSRVEDLLRLLGEVRRAPNENTCPLCLALPGVLPVLNRRVVEYAIKAGLATHCTIEQHSRWARKNYFYPEPAEGLSDQPVRAADLPRRADRHRDRRHDAAGTPHPHPYGRGHRQEHPRPARRREPRRLQPLRRAAAGDRQRARHPHARGGRGLSPQAPPDPPVPRGVRRQHGGG
jgi:hypothetical protein